MSNSRKNYYHVLGIQTNATVTEIKQAYMRQMLVFHPDKYKGDPAVATAKTQEIIEAYNILSNPRKKEIYDLGGDPLQTESTDNKQAATSSLPFEDEESKFRKDPNAKPDPNFKYQDFYNTAYTMAAHEHYAAITDYIIENIANLEMHITSGDQLNKLLILTYIENSSHLIRMFSSEWLKKQENFGNPSDLCVFLSSRILIEDWKFFLDHLGRHWFQNFVRSHGLAYFMESLSGIVRSADRDHYRDLQHDTLLTYLEQAWLRKFSPDALGTFLLKSYRPGDDIKVLTFLDGHDKWIQKNFTDGNSLGIVLNRSVEYLSDFEDFSNPNDLLSYRKPKLQTNAQEQWEKFLAYLSPSWKENFVNNPVELNALLNRLDEHEWVPNTQKIKLFLKCYLDKKNYTNLYDIIAVLQPSSEKGLETKGTGPLNAKKSLQFIHIFDKMEIFRIMKNQHKDEWFKHMLSTIDQYEHEPFYRGLLFAAAQACYVERQQNSDEYTSKWGSLFGCTRDETLKAANSVMRSILQDEPLEKMPGIHKGNLHDISMRYESSREPIKVQAKSSILLLR